MNNFIAAFSSVHDQVFRDHNEEAIYLANTFSRLLEELYDFMSTAYTAYNGSANLMKNILSDLKVVEALQRFDEETLREINPSMQKLSEVAKIYKNENMAIYTKLTHSKDRVKEEQRRLEDDMPNFDMLKELGFPNGLSICNEDDWFSKVRKSIILGFANFINDVEKIANSGRIKRFDNLSNSLQTLNQKTEDFSNMTIKFYHSIEKVLPTLKITSNQLTDYWLAPFRKRTTPKPFH